MAGRRVRKAARWVSLDPYANALAFFAAELKRVRASHGMTQEAVASAAGYAASTMAALETCRLLPSEDLAPHVDKVFGTDGHFERLQALVDQTSVLPWFRELPKVERSATEIRVYEPYQVPALLQTEQYMRAVASADRPMLSDAEIDRAVAIRTTRQEILEYHDAPAVIQEKKPRLWAIMDESVLHRVMGDPQVMAAQFEHLIALSRRPNITIQVITNAQGATCAFGRGFEVLVSGSDTLIYVEDIGSARYIRKTDEASQYVLVFDYLRASALDEARTLQLIRENIR
jgi:DNA-binding XRE family transcriptional regulator